MVHQMILLNPLGFGDYNILNVSNGSIGDP
jgi:hypothetical protein